MTKFISLLLSIVISLLVVLLPVKANSNDDTFTQKEAEELFLESFHRLSMLVTGYGTTQYSSPLGYRDDEIILSHQYDVSIEGEPGFDLYSVVVDERFNTLSKCYDYAKEVFTDTLAKETVDVAYGMTGNPELEKSRRFFMSDGTNAKYYDYESKEHIAISDGQMLYCGLTIGVNNSERLNLKRIGDFKLIDANTASLKAWSRLVFYLDYSVERLEYEFEVIFTKTTDGWKVSGGSFIDFMTYKVPYPDYPGNPSTGDSSPAVVGLALAALVSLAAPFVVKRRRARS